MSGIIAVGAIVRSEANPDWGQGQVQSIIGGRVTVNFEHAGKLVCIGEEAQLVLVRPDWD
ncbi:MAG: DUF3553 domain-containing protein [Pikeienuella sp.]